MDRRAVTTYFKANGGKIDAVDGSCTVYLFADESKVYECREKIPFETCYHGEREERYSLAVFFDKLKEVDPPKQEPGKIFDSDEFGRYVELACDQYEKSAPTVYTYVDDLYRRYGESPDKVCVSELGFLMNLYQDGQWLHPNVAANNCYKLMSRLGMDTTGQAGF